MQSCNVCIAGATGRVGQVLLRQLVQSPAIGRIVSVGREAPIIDESAKKKIEHIPWDFQNSIEIPRVDAAFCLLGSRSSKEHQLVDVDMTINFAKNCPNEHFSFLSSAFVNLPVDTDYINKKRAVEKALRELEATPRLSIFRPSFIMDTDDDVATTTPHPMLSRAWIRENIYPTVSQTLPVSYREVNEEDVARALRLNAEMCACDDKVEIIDFVGMMEIIGKLEAI